MSHPNRPPANDRVLLLMPTLTYRAGAFLAAAEQLGVPVAVGSPQSHVLSEINPSGLLQLDFNDLEGSTDRIVAYADAQRLAAIVSTDDEGVMLAALASEALGLKHSPLLAVRAARDKYQTRQALAAAGLNVPGYQRVAIEADPRRVADEISYPCVVKPLAMAASRGVMRADDPDQFAAAVDRLAGILEPDDTHFLVEDYIPGEEVALEGLLIGGELQALAIFDKPDPLEGPYFEETIYVTPSRHSPEEQAAIVDTTRDGLRALGLSEGPIHAELRLNEAGAWVIEIAPRSIGGYCSRALRFGESEGLEQRILEHALGWPLGSTEPASPASGVMMIPVPAAGELCEVGGVEAAKRVPGISELRIAMPIGAQVAPPPEGAQYLGFIFAAGEKPEQVEGSLRTAHEQLRFVIVPTSDVAQTRAPSATGDR